MTDQVAFADEVEADRGEAALVRAMPNLLGSTERERARCAIGFGQGCVVVSTGTNHPPVSVSAYVSNPVTIEALDARRFRLMRELVDPSVDSYVYTLGNGERLRRHTRAGGWRILWDHWGRRGADTNLNTWVGSDLPVLRMDEESGYEFRLGRMLERWR